MILDLKWVLQDLWIFLAVAKFKNKICDKNTILRQLRKSDSTNHWEKKLHKRIKGWKSLLFLFYIFLTKLECNKFEQKQHCLFCLITYIAQIAAAASAARVSQTVTSSISKQTQFRAEEQSKQTPIGFNLMFVCFCQKKKHSGITRYKASQLIQWPIFQRTKWQGKGLRKNLAPAWFEIRSVRMKPACM